MTSKNTKRIRQDGFSLIELMVSILILMVIMGSVFQQLDVVQKRSRSEEVKLDMFQTAREFVDQIVRDIHQAGFPNTKLSYYPSPGVNYVDAAIDLNNAVGVYYITPQEIRFQGDVDGDGNVDVVAYKLFPQTGNDGDKNCPCLRRSQTGKSAALPMDQVPDYRTQVENLSVVSKDPTDVSGTVIFIPYMKNGTPVDLSTYGGSLTKFNFEPKDDGVTGVGADPINAIWSVRVGVTVQAQTGDIGTNVKPQAFLTATAQVNN
ncbi:MAG: prepilin-type N-terminal cleavage/methylation domain-containing protein [Acidobacteriales bacterium]|nr:prepilin-type N-terminal cleavage/methylation domain-containing protein [Terriglobales bacterium]